MLSTKAVTLAVVLWGILVIVSGAPKSRNKSPQTIYDQKQSGEFNIQLHLKDFQIIALADEALGALGDYDYNYDYSDFTIKPSNSSHKPLTTSKPPSTQKPPSGQPISSSEKPLLLEKPINQSLDLELGSRPLNESIENQSINETIEQSTATTEKEENPLNNKEKEPIQIIESSRPPPIVSSQPPEESLDKIKVQIIETPVVPLDDGPRPSVMDLGELMHYRKCGVGYARDQKGRCRRVRRPSFNLGRLASTLAARFRTASPSSENLNEE